MIQRRALLYGESCREDLVRARVRALLHRRTLVICVGAEDTAVASFRTKERTALRTAVEYDTCINRHRLFLGEPTYRAVDSCRELHSALPSAACLVLPQARS